MSARTGNGSLTPVRQAASVLSDRELSDALDLWYRERAAEESDAGCWVAFGTDDSYHWSTTVFAEELSARRYAMENYMSVGFLRWGQSIGECAK